SGPSPTMSTAYGARTDGNASISVDTPFCALRRPTKSTRSVERAVPGVNNAVSTGMGATTGFTLGSTAPASPASQLDTAVTTAEWRSTWRNTGRAPTTVRASRTSLPWSVVMSGTPAIDATHVPTNP